MKSYYIPSTNYVASRKSGFLSVSSQFESKFSIRGYILTSKLFLPHQLRLQILISVYFSTYAVAFRRSALFMNVYSNPSSNLSIAPSNVFLYLSKIAGVFRRSRQISGSSYVPKFPRSCTEVMLRNTWIVSANPILLLVP